MARFCLLRMVFMIFVVCATMAIASPAQTFTTLHSFAGYPTDGANPWAGLVQASNGNFYGTTVYGGANGANPGGTVFEITPAGKLTTLYSFCSQPNCADGAGPFNAGLIQATNGNFYGTTEGGGANSYGTVFEITAVGKLTSLYSFCSQPNCTDGAVPEAGLVQATNGNVYGTTSAGGDGADCSSKSGCGTVFEITAAGKLTTLYSFCSQPNCVDGYNASALVQATNGNFYGTTAHGGTNYGDGTVFEITPAGKLTTLYSFCSQYGCTDGSEPVAGLVQATNGNFYGTTEEGGANFYGTVFEITPAGKLTTLYSFCSQTNCTDGSWPVAGLVQATNGNFYGTTSAGGANSSCYQGCGTVFEITPAGKLTTLYSFCSQPNCVDGDAAFTGLVQATNGKFYGTTEGGGADGYGTVFSLAVGLGPFVETRPTSGKVGTKVIILGNNLKGTTSVAFNGTAAAFEVVSNTEIKTSVPNGATTGYVMVTTPKKKLKSNVVFRVRR